MTAAMREARQQHQEEVRELKEKISKLKEGENGLKDEHKQQIDRIKIPFTQKVEQSN